MAKKIEVVCDFCDHSFEVSEEQFNKSETFDCPSCYSEVFLAETPEQQEYLNQEFKEKRDSSRSYQVRIMARGEDGLEFCIKNNIDANDELLDLALEGAKVKWPEAKIWIEEE